MSASPRKQEDTRKPGQIVNWKWEKRKWRDVFKTIMRPQNGKPVARKSYCNHFFWWFTLNFKGVHGQIIHGILLGTLFAAFCLPGIDWIGLDYPAGRCITQNFIAILESKEENWKNLWLSLHLAEQILSSMEQTHFFHMLFRGPLYRDATIVEAGGVAGRL